MRRLVLASVAALALGVLSGGCAAEGLNRNEPLPAPMAEYQYFPGEDGLLRSIRGIESPRSDADLVRMAQAACRAILEEQASRGDLRPGITQWAQVTDAEADEILTAASANLCETAVLVND